MKTQKSITLILLSLFLFMSSNTHAQFLDKLKKRAQKAAEETVLRKAEQKAAQKTEKALEKVFNGNLGQKMTEIDPALLNKSYDFSWRYTLEMEHKKGSMKMHYHLKDKSPYYGNTMEMDSKQPMQGLFIILDREEKIMAMLMKNDETNFGQIMTSPEEDITETIAESGEMADAQYKQIGTKTILGYECQGFEIENDEMKMTMYVAFDTPVSFNQVYGGANSQRLPKGLDPKWLDKIGDNSLMMEMDVVNKKKSKENVKMTCVALEEEPKEVKLSDYQFLQTQLKN